MSSLSTSKSKAVKRRVGGQERSVFVTVGTTLFDDLIKASTTQQFCELLVELGYTKLILQIGRGNHTPEVTSPVPGLALSWYRYKDSLGPDMQAASLIISHGGVGCILEGLSLGKPLVAVVNQQLMDNHQTELAEEMSARGHLLCTTHSKLYNTVQQLPQTKLVDYKRGDPQILGREIDRIMGFTSQHQN